MKIATLDGSGGTDGESWANRFSVKLDGMTGFVNLGSSEDVEEAP